MMTQTSITGPIAIGGIGGSGTRIVAQFLQSLGVYIGDDLPKTTDTIWYAALFGRRDVLLDDPVTIRALCDLFCEQMAHARTLTDGENALLAEICRQPRHQHNPPMIDKWMTSFIAHTNSGKVHDTWGWKVPYTHVLIDRFLDWYPDLKYIHITRNGLDMAFNKNQNQLGKWGPVYLSRNVELTPSDSLSYWCAVHRRMARITALYPTRIFHLDYDKLITDPRPQLAAMFEFVGAGLDDAALDDFAAQIFVPDSVAQRKMHNLSLFDPADLAYLQAQELGTGHG
jgi:hypothetical protein